MVNQKPAAKKPAKKPASPAPSPVQADTEKREKHLRPLVIVQYQGLDVKTEDLVSAAISEFKAAHPRMPVVTLDLYVKPEERAAYYVANSDFTGKLNF